MSAEQGEVHAEQACRKCKKSFAAAEFIGERKKPSPYCKRCRKIKAGTQRRIAARRPKVVREAVGSYVHGDALEKRIKDLMRGTAELFRTPKAADAFMRRCEATAQRARARA